MVTKDNYLVLEKDDLDKIKLKTTNTINVKEFVEEKLLCRMIRPDINLDQEF